MIRASSKPSLLLVVLALLAAVLVPLVGPGAVGTAGAQEACPEGQILAPDGVTCGIPVSECPPGTILGPDGAICEPIEGEQGVEGEEGVEGEGEGEGEPADGGEAEGENEGEEGDDPGELECPDGEELTDGACAPPPPRCPEGYALGANDECYEILDPGHSCVSAGRIPSGVTTNAELSGFTFLPGTGECLPNSEFRARVANFEASVDEERDALTRLRETNNEVVAIESLLVDIDRQLRDVRRQMLAAETEASRAKIRRDASAKELWAVSSELERQRAILRDEAVSVYMGGGHSEQVAQVLLGIEKPNDFEASIDYAQALFDDQQRTIDTITVLGEETALLVVELEDAIDEANAATDAIVEVENEFERLRLEQLQLLQDKDARRLAEAEQIASIRENKSEYARDLGSFSDPSREIEDILLEATGGDSYDGGEMLAPLDPLKIGSVFGPRMHPVLGYVRQHDGLDMSAPSGAPIASAASGVVVVASSQGGYGNTVVVDHGGGLATLYAHQSQIAVDVGNIVDRGDVLGFVGSTGLSTGPHLHWEVRRDGVPVDPMPYLTGPPDVGPAPTVAPAPTLTPVPTPAPVSTPTPDPGGDDSVQERPQSREAAELND